MTTRRGFLKAILAAGIAPAIVRAESLMKIVVPKPVLLDGFGGYIQPTCLNADFGTGDFTIETWIQDPKIHLNEWNHIALIRIVDTNNDIIYKEYLNGNAVSNGKLDTIYPNISLSFKKDTLHIESKDPVYLDEYRVTKGIARKVEYMSLERPKPSFGIYLNDINGQVTL